MSSASMAYVSSISRLYKSKTLTRSLVTEILSENNWKDAISILKDRGFIEEIPNSIEEFEKILKQRAITQIKKFSNLASSVKMSHDILQLYYYLFTLDEFKGIVSSIYNKVELPTTDEFSKLIESKPSTVEELRSNLKGSIYGEGLEYALNKNPKDVSQINSLLDFYFIEKLSQIVESLRGDWKASADAIICTYKDYYSISLALRKKMLSNISCEVSLDTIRELSTTQDLNALVDIIRRTVYSKFIKISDPYSTMASLYRYAKMKARRGAVDTFMGSPFTPVTALALAELVRLDTEDLITIINGLKIGMNKENIKEKLSLEIV
ncbi:V0D/AC39 family V-type ATPase subunit [Acidianus manzaensis]|uniref:ATPase n=1 Tax=Acidianus manzaensis TaxID=282676 RepID=A0A1W6JZU8_9CREN|nr:V-type ATPase subunit [Acidianus manzaensis]ARM75796.1 ATPase [Acidianus manzaensis]